MDSNSLTRKQFITLTFTLIGGSAVITACSSTSSGGGTGGATGAGGSGSGAGGSQGSDAAADIRPDTANSCADPLPTSQVADSTAHTHTLDIPASMLASTTMIRPITGGFPATGSGAHFHQITLTADNLATIRGGGSVTVMSSMDGTPTHSHMYTVSCTRD